MDTIWEPSLWMYCETQVCGSSEQPHYRRRVSIHYSFQTTSPHTASCSKYVFVNLPPLHGSWIIVSNPGHVVVEHDADA